MFLKNTPLVIALGLLSVIMACNKDKGEDPIPDEPTINLLVNGSDRVKDLTSSVGDTIVLSGEVTAKATIKNFEGRVIADGASLTLVTFGGDSSSTLFVIDPIKYVVGFASSGKTIEFSFSLSDMADRADSVSFLVDVTESPILDIQQKFIGGYGHSTYGNLLNILEDTAYFTSNVKTSTDNQEGVDLIASYDTDTGWSLSSVDDDQAPTTWNESESVNFNWPFTDENSTRLIELADGFNYEEVLTAVQLDELFEGTGSSSVSSLSEGQVLAFKLASDKGGKIGVLKIVDFTGAVNKPDYRQIEIAYKVQK